MTRVEESVRVAVPVRTAYDQWTQFEDFPRFMEGVEEIRQIDDRHLHWKVNVAGRTAEFDAVITEQIPDARVAWKTTAGPHSSGAVDFHRLDGRSTEVTVVMEVEPAGAAGLLGDVPGVLQRRVRDDLHSFKRLVESRQGPTAGWRGEIRPQGSGEHASLADRIAAVLLAVGAVNWGLVSLARLDLISRLAGRRTFGETTAASRAAYGLLGAAGVYSVVRRARRARSRTKGAS